MRSILAVSEPPILTVPMAFFPNALNAETSASTSPATVNFPRLVVEISPPAASPAPSVVAEIAFVNGAENPPRSPETFTVPSATEELSEPISVRLFPFPAAIFAVIVMFAPAPMDDAPPKKESLLSTAPRPSRETANS